MLKTLGFLAVGLVAGALVMSFYTSDPPPPTSDFFARAESALSTPSAVSASEHATLVERVSYLERRLDELHSALEQRTADVEDSVRNQIAQEVQTAIASSDVGRFLTTGVSRDGTIRVPPAGAPAAAWTFEQNGAVVQGFSVPPNVDPTVPPMPGSGPGGAPRNLQIPTNARNASPSAGPNPGAGPAPNGSGGPNEAASGNAPVLAATGPPEAPQNLVGIEAYQGQTFTFRVTGSTEGTVWGSDIYTDDSSIARAAVHAGLLRPGETGTILVSVLPGYPSYAGSDRFGVASSNYGEWNRSYYLQRLNSVAANDSGPALR